MEGFFIFVMAMLVFVVGMVSGSNISRYEELEKFTSGALVHTEHFVCDSEDISNCDYYDVYVVASKYDTRFSEPSVNLGKDGVGITFTGANAIFSSKRIK